FLTVPALLAFPAFPSSRPLPVTASASFPDMTLAVHHMFDGSQGQKAHGPPRVQFLRTDAQLGAEAELKAVGETGGGIDIHRRRVHRLDEPAGPAVIPR